MSKYRLRGKGEIVALAVLAAVVVAAPAQANPVRFDNPAGAGHFVWYGGGSTGIGLNVTLDAASQTGAWGEGIDTTFLQYAPDANSQRVKGWTGYLQCAGTPASFLVGVNYLDPIPTVPPGYTWKNVSYVHHNSYPTQTQLPVGVEKYLGVYFPQPDGTHYGYIGVVMDSSYNLDAFAWGCETTANTSIQAGIPEPTALALLAFGAVAAVRRRR